MPGLCFASRYSQMTSDQRPFILAAPYECDRHYSRGGTGDAHGARRWTAADLEAVFGSRRNTHSAAHVAQDCRVAPGDGDLSRAAPGGIEGVPGALASRQTL